MKMLTKSIRKTLPELYANDTVNIDGQPQEGVSDPMVILKFFGIWSAGGCTWYVTEGSPVLNDDGEEVDFRFYGLIEILPNYPEMGYFLLSELESLKMGSLPIVERDMYFSPKPVSTFK